MPRGSRPVVVRQPLARAGVPVGLGDHGLGQGLTFTEAIESGAASASGDGEALRRLTGLFRLPPPHTRNR